MNETPLTLAALGDSLTQGIGDEEQLGWVGRVAQKAALSREVTLYNLGVRGNTSLDLSRRVQTELEARLEPESDAVLLLGIGTNDTAFYRGKERVPQARSVQLVERILQQMERFGRVYWISPFPVAEKELDFEPRAGEVFSFRRERLLALNEAYREIAASRGISYLDLFAIFEEKQISLGESADGIHPRGTGYQTIAGLVSDWSDLQSRLKGR